MINKMKSKYDEIKSIDEIFGLISNNLEILNTLFKIAFKFTIFNPKPTLIYELSKPIRSIYDLNIKLLQFGLLIDSIPKNKIDQYLKKKLEINSKELKEKYKKKCCKIITNEQDIEFYKVLFNNPDEKTVFIEVRNFNTIDSLELFLKEEIKNFDDQIVDKIRLLRSFRNISEYAHDVDPNKIHNKFKKLGLSYLSFESNPDEFWRVFLNHFLDIIFKLKSLIQSHITNLDNKDILSFKSFFDKKEFNKDELNRIIFEFENKKDANLYLNAYKIDFLYDNKILFQGNWGVLSKKVPPHKKVPLEWGKVKPSEYYGLRKEGKWKIISSIQYNYENELITRVIEDISDFKITN